jgi:AraC-like DNA-binding protein/quercetin dioxygenase-like cupin family protein
VKTYRERGYLLENFRLFHMSVPLKEEVDFHYHTFHKIVIPIKGRLSYMIEGRHYHLEPYDIALIGRGCVHKPETDESNERVLFYLSSEYLRTKSTDDFDIESCFVKVQESGSFVLRLNTAQISRISKLIHRFQEEEKNAESGSALMCDILMQEIMVEITRLSIKQQSYEVDTVYDEKIVSILNYINDNLTDNITNDYLAEHFYMSKYHMMRKFKEETGYTIHNYLSNKRLMLAQKMLEEGASSTDACYGCGFRDYSVFSKAYKKLFSISPGKSK